MTTIRNTVTATKKSSGKRPIRAKSREQLIETGLAMLADGSLGEASILQLATAAGVSNGTFYNYFQSKDELVEALAVRVSDELAGQLRQEFLGVEDPAQRIVIAARTFMGRAIAEPVFGWALLRLIGTLPKLSETIRESILLDVREGRVKKRFRYVSEAAATDLVWGTLIAGVRSLLEQREDAAHMDAIAEISLVGLGMELKEAHAVVLSARPD